MKILKIFEEKLRYKNYSERSITLYVSYLSFFLKEEAYVDSQFDNTLLDSILKYFDE
jgi:hypothetical protein